MSLFDELNKKIDEKRDRLIEIRRYLHENPELSFEETETSKYIQDFYDNVEIDKIDTKVGEMYGHLVTIEGAGDGPTIALRADFDALPIQEDSGVDFQSKVEGVMHACGHDGHTAYMLILAESLAELKDQINGTIKIIHQPAEEVPPGGAKTMIEAGVLDGVDAVFGIHVMTNMESGTVAYRPGPTQTGRDFFNMKIQGKGGHGSSPHQANDAIVAGASFVMNAQTYVSRRVNPFDMAVLTIGNFDGKGQFNIIKDSVELDGDIRTMSPEAKELAEREVKRYAKGLEETFDVTVELDYNSDYPVLINDEEVTERVGKALNSVDVPEIKNVEVNDQQAPSEDFAYYLVEKPGTFFYVGATPAGEEGFPHHHPKFKIDEESLFTAAKAMAAVVNEWVG